MRTDFLETNAAVGMLGDCGEDSYPFTLTCLRGKKWTAIDSVGFFRPTTPRFLDPSQPGWTHAGSASRRAVRSMIALLSR